MGRKFLLPRGVLPITYSSRYVNTASLNLAESAQVHVLDYGYTSGATSNGHWGVAVTKAPWTLFRD